MLENNPLPGYPLIDSPFFDDFAENLYDGETLSIARNLHENGFAVIEFPDPDFDRISQGIMKDLHDNYDWEKWRRGEVDSLRIQDAWTFDPRVKQIACNKNILDLLSQLYGRRAFPFQTLNFPVGTQQAGHSDHVHFHSVPERFMCGVWVAFEDMDEDNGPLFYYPGSNKWPIIRNEHIGIGGPDIHHPYPHYRRYVELWEKLAETQKIKRRTFKARKGQALIWTANLVHGGSAQKDVDRTRWSQVTHYFFEGCGYTTPIASDPWSGSIHYRDILDIATSQKMPNIISGHELSAETLKTLTPEFGKNLHPEARNKRISALAAQPSKFKNDPRIPGDFNAENYLRLNPDLVDAEVDPFRHYVEFGLKEKRRY